MIVTEMIISEYPWNLLTRRLSSKIKYQRQSLLILFLQFFFSRYFAHRIILARGSDVFDRMLSHKWDGNKKEIELSEDPQCIDYFETFLKFFYSNHVQLNDCNTLPLLILADKYNFNGLKTVCVNYAITYVLKELPLKEIVNVWFNYSSKTCHTVLIQECIRIIGSNLTEVISSEEWTKDWMALDRDQLIEILKSNDLVVPSELRELL